MQTNSKFSLILPIYNEEKIIEQSLNQILKLKQENKDLFEIIIVNDGSSDSSSQILKRFENNKDLKIIDHDKNCGYGRAIKTGISQSSNENIFITDIDGTYPNDKIIQFYLEFSRGNFDMLVGSRSLMNSGIPIIRIAPKYLINKLANYLVQQKIPDLNSGFRVFKKKLYKQYENLLPDGFSFTTTITLAFISDFRKVEYQKINYEKRIGKSKIHPIKDTLNFVILILRVVIYFSPLRVFIPLSLMILFIGTSLIIYRVINGGQFLVTSIILFFFAINFLSLGLIADLINKKK